MKKITAFLLASIILISCLGVSAAENSQMEKILGIVKTRVLIPESHSTFDYSLTERGAVGIYNFNWSSEDDGYISIACDSRGIITSYYSYDRKSNYYSDGAKLPNYSKAQCADLAIDFFAMLNPDISQKFKLSDQNYSHYGLSTENYFNFTRVENDITADMDYASVSVNAQTGQATNFNLNYSEITSFPDPKDSISLEDAQKAYGEKIGLHLVYNPKWEDNKMTPVLEYIPNGTGSEKINAVTGEIFTAETYYNTAYNEKAMDMAMGGSSRAYATQAPVFTEQELKSIDENTGLMPKEQIVEKTKKISILNIPADAAILSSSTYKNNESYITHITLSAALDAKGISEEKVKLMTAAGDLQDLINISADSKTGDLLSFSRRRYDEDNENTDEQKTLEAAKILLGEKAGEFSIYQNRVLDFEAALSSRIQPIYRDGLTLVRMVNGIPFTGNPCSISLDSKTGFISYFYYSYDNLNFPSADGVISEEEALKAVFSSIDYNLKYTQNEYRNHYDSVGVPINVSLVYELSVPPVVDAKTAKLNNQDLISEKEKAVYTDIDDHWAKEKIEILSEYGIYFDGTEFRPEDKILQEEFIALISIVFGNNSFEVLRAPSEIYSYYYVRNILNEDEKKPNGDVSRFEAVKFMLRAMGAEEYAKLDGIYNVPFNDISENIGYAALALGLKLISAGDSFKPEASLTRAEAITMVYNYLTR